uniref:ubiquitinyl hydrolase 1 n=2 Tax=Lutzomyia longipalpis TaxID=7200 RepID=A0A1B0C837_LUTLO
MECPHLSEECVKINREFVRKLKIEISTAAPSLSKTWRCLECASMKENWMCLNCGTVLCGRYEKCHALRHSSSRNDHKICMSMMNFSVYCYKCDEFVVNDTKEMRLCELRQELNSKDDDSASETSTSSGVDDPAVVGRKYHQEMTSASSSSDSGWEEMPHSRKLRPRKRTISSDSVENTKRKSLRKVVGLRNLGNTCFMNSVLQSLSNIHEFSCYFSALPAMETNKQKRFYHSRSIKENVHDANVVEELRKVLLNLSQGGGSGSKAISPECLFLVIWKVVPQFRGHRQHDAHEFLRYMLDRLHTELQQINCVAQVTGWTKASCDAEASVPGGIFKGRNSIVTTVFGGILQSEVRCLICGMESKKHDPFLDLSLDIPEKFYKECNEDNQTVCNISDCLSSFTEIEELAETELYYCSSCK